MLSPRIIILLFNNCTVKYDVVEVLSLFVQLVRVCYFPLLEDFEVRDKPEMKSEPKVAYISNIVATFTVYISILLKTRITLS